MMLIYRKLGLNFKQQISEVIIIYISLGSEFTRIDGGVL